MRRSRPSFKLAKAAIFYSDRIVEAHNPKGKMFGFPRLRAFVAEHGKERSLEEALLEELYSFAGEGWEQEDDITLLTLRSSQLSVWELREHQKVGFREK
jgi:serine phosphatase RsbU (regulator of sigma subunit)